MQGGDIDVGSGAAVGGSARSRRAGRGARRATAAHSRADTRSSGAWRLHLAAWVLELDWCALRVDAGPVCGRATRRCRMDSRPLGRQWAGLGVGRRPLALRNAPVPSHSLIRRDFRARTIQLLLLAGSVLAPTLGWAQQSLEDQSLQQQGLSQGPAGWGATVGAGVAAVPRYPGASRERARLVPLISFNFGDRLFVGPFGIGFTALRRNGFRAGPVLGFERGRSASDDPHLAGLGDISASVTAGLFARYARGPFEISATARQALSHSTNGLSGLLQLSARHVFSGARTLVAVGPDLEFGNGDFQRTWFGISPAQSAASGLPLYMPHAGINRVGLHAGLTYRVSTHLVWRVFARISDLTAGAGQSPVVERRSQVLVGAGVAYHF